MSEITSVIPTLPTNPPDKVPHLETVQSKVPAWLKRAPEPVRDGLRKAGPAALPWVVQARSAGKETFGHLQEAYARHLGNEQRVHEVLAQLPAPEAFAEPLLKAAIAETFGLQVDVNATWLFSPQRAAAAGVQFPPEAPLSPPGAMQAAVQTLLKSALQNFEEWETAPDALSVGDNRAMVLLNPRIEGLTVSGTVLDIVPEQFAALCRTLDLGGQYQALIQATFNPQSFPGDASDAAAFNLRGDFELFEQSAFQLQVHLALLRKTIDQATSEALLLVARNRPAVLDGRPLLYSFLTLWDITLTGIVVIGPDRSAGNDSLPVVVYIPDDPYHPLKTYPSAWAFIDSLRDSMLEPGYLKFFERFVPARDRAALFGHIQQAFYPKVWNSGGWYEQTLDPKAKLKGAELPFADFLSGLHRQKVAVLKDDGLFHAVPTAEEDHKSLSDKLSYLFDKTLIVLNTAAFVVPGLGEVMLGVMAMQLSYETFEGIQSLTRGEQDQAWGYFMDVVENGVLLAALGGLGAGSGGMAAVEVPEAVAAMRKVGMADGSVRLWTPDLRPFAHDIVLPAGLKPNESGLYEHQGKHWLPLDGATYSVKADPYRLQHPNRPDAYEPRLRHNGAGAWLHELDQPLEWEGLRLLRRLGFASETLSDEEALRALRISGCPEATLRHALAEGQRPPALLMDTVQRLKLDREAGLATGEGIGGAAERMQLRREWFATRYQALQAEGSAQVALVRRSFPGLPGPVVDELLLHATPVELEQMQAQQRVPQRLAEEARAYLQQTRLARACEGLFLESVYNPDSEKLLLPTVETMPGWSPLVRLEVRQASFHGPLIDSLGPADAPIRKVLVKQGEHYQARDADDQHLHGSDDFYVSLLHALPDEQRAQLGFPHVGQGAELKQALQAAPPLPQHRVRELLQMQAVKPSARSPMRLADGRLGYPLSGRGVLQGYVREQTLLDKIRALGLRSAYPEEVLQELYSAGLGRAAIDARLNYLLLEELLLRASFAEWEASVFEQALTSEQHLSRHLISEAIWDHWEANSLPERGRPRPLRLNGVSLQDFPENLPDFVYERVHALELNGSILNISTGLPHSYLELFLRRFPYLSALAVRRGTAVEFNLAWRALRGGAVPRLSHLELTDMNASLSWEIIDFLSRRLNLRRLDLSGNELFLADIGGGHMYMSLSYLGLDRVGLNQWPWWLNSEALAIIGEVSLRGNNITVIPDFILANPLAGEGMRTRLSLQGNPLTPRMLRPLQVGWRAERRFSVGFDVPESFVSELNRMEQERVSLSQALDQWAEASSSSAPPSAERLTVRGHVRDMLVDFWRAYRGGTGERLLRLDSVDLDDFPPTMPQFPYHAVDRLELIRPTATPEALNRFLGLLPGLTEVTLIEHVTPLLELPEALVELPALRVLTLRSQGLLIDQAAMGFFARIPGLVELNLDGNVMGTVRDVSALRNHRGGLSLSLNNVGLDSWPEWIDSLLPDSLDRLSLQNNRITRLPQYLLDNHRDDFSCVEIVLRGNPLDEDEVAIAYESQSFNRPYSFDFDGSEEWDHRGGRPAPHSSDSETSFTEAEAVEHFHGGATSEPDLSVDPWLGDLPDLEPGRRESWQQMSSDPTAFNLLGIIAHLRNTADYRGIASRSELIGRVWRVLDAAADDEELRLMLNAMAEEPLLQVIGHDTCPDGIRVAFNQMEVEVYIRQTLRDIPEEGRGQALYRLTRRLYRSHALDGIARRNAGSRDEAEVRLAYCLRWAAELDLPLPPSRMLFRATADLRPRELDDALAEVRRGERGQEFLDYAFHRDFWMDYLRETYPERFRALKSDFEARVLALSDRYPDDEPARMSERIGVLEAQFQQNERTLVQELTNREEFAGH